MWLTSSYEVGLGINRNIVECKEAENWNCKMGISVLIETLWNVKCYISDCGGSVNIVLIETLWNVKRRKAN